MPPFGSAVPLIAAMLAAPFVPLPPLLVFNALPPLLSEQLPSIDERFRMYVWRRGACEPVMRAMNKDEVFEALEPCWAAFLPHA